MSVITLNKLRSFEQTKLNDAIKTKDKFLINKFLDEWGLCIKDKKIFPRPEYKDIWGEAYDYYDKIQLVKKISLNSAYGALLNAGSRFFDQRLGQSTTLTGRTITRHMAAKTNEVITGDYDYSGTSIQYGDTDSTYFSAYNELKSDIAAGNVVWTPESIIDMYNNMAAVVSDTFPDFLLQTLNIPKSRTTGVIASSRETVSKSTLFIVKKRYAALMIDKDGIRLDVNGKPGKVKAMGLDLKRADTPKLVQVFLSDILMDTLTGKGETFVIDKICKFKEEFENLKPWQQGTPKAVNKLTHYRELEELHMVKKANNEAKGGVTMPGHVRASLLWNHLRDVNHDQHSMRITDGQKVIVCKLVESIENSHASVAYPTDEGRLPDWFTALPFDTDGMMAGIVDKKVENLVGVLKWSLDRTKKSHAHMSTLFDFGAI